MPNDDQLTEREKEIVAIIGRRLPTKCHVWMTNLGVPAIVAILLAVLAQAVWTRDATRDSQKDISWIKDNVTEHERWLKSLSATVDSLLALESNRPIRPQELH